MLNTVDQEQFLFASFNFEMLESMGTDTWSWQVVSEEMQLLLEKVSFQKKGGKHRLWKNTSDGKYLVETEIWDKA